MEIKCNNNIYNKVIVIKLFHTIVQIYNHIIYNLLPTFHDVGSSTKCLTYSSLLLNQSVQYVKETGGCWPFSDVWRWWILSAGLPEGLQARLLMPATQSIDNIFSWPCAAFMLRRRCQPSTSLFERMRRLQTLQLAGGQTVESIHVDWR